MNQFFLRTLLSFFSFSSSFAQTALIRNTFEGTINGVVIDSTTQTTLSKVTVTAQEVQNSKYRKSTVTNENGYFELKGLPDRHYQIVLTFIGYKTRTIVAPYFTSSKISIGKTALVSMTGYLNEVQVVTVKQLIEQNADKIIYNVDADPESKSATALDILQKIPMLTLDADGNLRINGNNSYQVLINGKPSVLFLRNPADVFKNMPAGMMKTIEVITSPSSRYEANGVGGVINITTYKKSVGGYNGGVDLRGSDPRGYSVSSIISTTLGKFGLSGNYSFNTSTDPANSSTFYSQDKLQNNRLNQTGISRNTNTSQNCGSELTWMMNEQNLLTFSYRRNHADGNSNSLQQVRLLNATGNVAEAYKNINDGRNKSRDNDFALDYQCNSKKNDVRQFIFSYRWSNSLNHGSSYFVLQPLINYNGRASTTADKDKYREHTFQADYTQPIKKHLLELGISAIYRRSNSDYFYKDRDSVSGVFVLDSSQSNNFNYEEDIYAGYFSLSLRMDKWGLRTGTRLELAKVNAHFISSGTTAIQEYLNLIPNVTLSRRLKGIRMLKMSYSQRLQRPHLLYLNPYLDLTDPRNISYGNPRLQPAMAHVFELTFNTFVKSFSINLSAFHQFINNSIQQFTTLGSDTIARTTYGNIGKSQNSGLSLSSSITMFKKLSININGGVNKMHFSNTIGGKLQTRKGLTYNASALLNLRHKNWRIGGNMNYNAPNIQVQGRTASFVSNSVTLNRLFLNNKINIGLLVSNPFHKYRRSFNEINDQAFYQFRESFSVLRRYSMSLNYRFSKVQVNGNSKSKK